MEPADLLSINPLLMDRTRLAIITTLAREEEPMAFGTMLERLNLTRGNLSVHTRKLEEDGLIVIEKKFLDRKPVTTYACTDKGREDIQKYLEAVELLLKQSLKKTGDSK
jgi:DNA-binding MarR family transcriptional regulator